MNKEQFRGQVNELAQAIGENIPLANIAMQYSDKIKENLVIIKRGSEFLQVTSYIIDEVVKWIAIEARNEEKKFHIEYMTVMEASKKCGYSERWIRTNIKRGVVRSQRRNKQTFALRADVDNIQELIIKRRNKERHEREYQRMLKAKNRPK